MTKNRFRGWLLAGGSLLLALVSAQPALAADAAAAADTADAGAPIRNTDDIVVSATKVNNATPITASVHTTQPQSIVSRSIIEDSVSATSDFSDVVLLTPGASSVGNGGGPGLTESKTVLRGFQDGFFNITYDGIPFGDSNDPTHHSTSYFPDGTYERIIVDRGPGGATDLGQASFGGNIHMVSREAQDQRFGELQLVGGSWNTYLARATYNTGAIDSLGGLKMIAIGEYKRTDTALTGSNAWFVNGFLKLEKPLGDNAKFSFVTSYNQNLYHQSDNNGVSCTAKLSATNTDTSGDNCVAGSQVATYGKNFGLVDFNDSRFDTTPWTASRKDWNWTNKTTDFEIARLQWNLTPNLSLDNKWYTYFYKNFTVSAEDTTTPCTGSFSETTCGGMKTVAAGTAAGGYKGASVAGDIPGYTKVNQYRTSGDILQLTWNVPFAVVKGGVWYEYSTSHRYRYDYDFTKGFNAGAISDGNFDFAGMSQFYNYKESFNAWNTQLGGAPVPAYVKYDEYSSWEQIQGFGEIAFKLFNDALTITPGIKVQNFTRMINTPLAAQSSRAGINAKASYKPNLPYATVNWLIRPNLSVYAQFAKGFLIPSLGNSLETVIPSGSDVACQPGVACNLQPTKTTNYQVGAVYAGDRVNLDADGYYIKSSNSTSVDPSTGIATQTSTPAIYKGLEGQASAVVMHGLTVIANGSIMSSKDQSTGLWLSQAPNYTATAGLVYADKRFKFSYIHKFTGRQFADSAELVRIAPYSLGQLSASTKVGPAWLGVSVYNVFNDRSTVKIGSATKATPLYFFLPGRSFQVQLKSRF